MVEYTDMLHVSSQKKHFRSESRAKKGEKTMRDFNETGVLYVVALLLVLRHSFYDLGYLYINEFTLETSFALPKNEI